MIAQLFRAVKSAYGNSGESNLRLTNYSSLATAKVEPDFTELLRSGQRFGGGCQVIASGIAAVAAIPTTTASLVLFNGENQGGKSYLVDCVTVAVVTTAPTTGHVLFAGLSNGRITAPAAAANYSSQSLSGSSKATKAIWATAITFAAGTSWINSQASPVVTAAGIGGENGTVLSRFLIPPQYALGFGILVTTSTLHAIHATWSELDIELE